MRDILFNWTRYWRPREGHHSLADDGFLYVPSPESSFPTTDVRAFEAFANERCLILLGEPGIGKSHACLAEFDRVKAEIDPTEDDRALFFDLRTFSSETRFLATVFDGPIISDWKSGRGALHLFLDSLDEGLLRIDVLAALLSDQFAGLPLDRLFLRIACRGAQWPSILEAELKRLWKDWQQQKHWNEEPLRVIELMPLSRNDVSIAAGAHGVDAEVFVEQIISREVTALAIKPVTLNFLISIYQRSGSFPSEKRDLYETGCRILCEEAQSRRDTKLSGALTSQERLHLAERVAAIMVFGNRYAVWIGSEAFDVPEEDVLLRDLAGGSENVDGTTIEAKEQAILETLGTGLFSSRGLNRIGWAHQTYAEFLAASYMLRHSVEADQLLSLITSPEDPENRVVPQLEDTVAWISSDRTDVFDILVRRDPDSLVRGDVLKLDESRRSALVDALLAFYEEGRGIDNDWGLRKHFRKLTHEAICDQLRPFIIDSSRNFMARRVASEIAAECGCKQLLDALLHVALNPTDVGTVRTHAARAIVEIGDHAAIRKLLPLAKGELTRDDDDDDELKGVALGALWPSHISTSEMFGFITVPPLDDVIGAYRAFLYTVPQQLQFTDVPHALSWVERNQSFRRLPWAFLTLTDAIMHAAWMQANTPHDYTRFAKAALARLKNHHHIIGGEHAVEFWEGLRLNPRRRRTLVKCLVNEIKEPENETYLIAGRAILTGPEDLEWLIEELESAATDRERHIWSILIVRLFDRDNPEQVGLVLATAETNASLREELEPVVTAVEIGSERATQQKRIFEAELEVRSAGEPVTLSPPPLDCVEAYVAIAEAGDPCAFWPAMRIMTLEPSSTHYGDEFEPDIRVYPVWLEATDDLRERILAVSRAYVSHCDPNASAWFLSDRHHRPATVGYQLLRLLADEDPQFVATLPKSVWEKWIPVLLTFPMYGGHDNVANHTLVCLAMRHAPEALVSAVCSLVRAGKEGSSITVFQRLNQCWNEELTSALRSLLQDQQASLAAFDTLLGVSFEHDAVWAESFSLSLLASLPTPEPRRPHVAVAAARVLAHSPALAWPPLWTVLESDTELGKSIIMQVANTSSIGRRDLRSSLSEDYIVDLYLWIERHWPHREDTRYEEGGWLGPRDAIASFRDSLVTALQQKGSFESSRAVTRIANALPHLPWLRWAEVEARESARRGTWVPLTPREILKLATNGEVRLIQSGDDLLAVITHSLGKLEAKLQSETPVAFALWDEMRLDKAGAKRAGTTSFRPKDENHLSDFIKVHLEEDLRSRGVLFNREVQIRRGEGIGAGETTDIHVDANIPGRDGKRSHVCLIIEVKGCWNGELKTAMETQLVNRYLNQNDRCSHGIYVVGWFTCPQWDTTDYRRNATPNWSVGDARDYFARQADALCNGDVRVSGVVLNTALR